MTRKTRVFGLAMVVGTVCAALLLPRARSTLSFVRAGTAYAAKALCTGTLVAGMDPERLLNEELAPGRNLVRAEILENEGEVRVEALFGLVKARARQQGNLGCSLYHKGDPPVAIPPVPRPEPSDPEDTTEPWPVAPFAAPEPPAGVDTLALKAALDDAFSEPDPENPRRTRAVVVVKDGWVVAERYAPGIGPSTPLSGWSMTKSVTHALVGIAVADGMLALDRPVPVPEWSAPDDPRRSITLDQLLRMSSGLAFSESYDDFTSDVFVMLFLARDAAAVAANQPLQAEPGTRWQYSSGTTNLVSRGLRLAVADDEAYWRFPYERLFEPLGMHSAILETDPSGTFVGSSFGYATARDWARFGLLYLNDGGWEGKRILPEGWVRHGTTPTPGSGEGYGAHWWLNRGGPLPGLPPDEFQAEGFDGQWVMVIPSRNTVLVRLGQTPGDGFDADAFGSAVLDALPGPGGG